MTFEVRDEVTRVGGNGDILKNYYGITAHSEKRMDIMEEGLWGHNGLG